MVDHELTRFRSAFQLATGRYELQPECGQQVAQPVVERVLRDAAGRTPGCQLMLGVSYASSEAVERGRRVVVLDEAGHWREIECRYLIGASRSTWWKTVRG